MGLAGWKQGTDYDVMVAGGGPVGLLVAGELGLAGVRVLVVERLTEIDQTIKAFGIQAPTADALYRRGLMPALLETQRQTVEGFLTSLTKRSNNAPSFTALTKIAGHFAGLTVDRDLVDYGDPDFGNGRRAPDPMPVGQQAVEAILGEWVRELGVEVRRGVELTGFDASDDGVTVHLDTGRPVAAGWLVGADGGRSLVRQHAGFPFPGSDPEIIGRQAIVELNGAEALRPGWNRTATGLYAYTPIPGRILTVELDGPPTDRDTPISREELQVSLRRVSGTGVTVTAMRTGTRFTDNARQATTYQRGRVLLAGDAAHVHSPFGGQGLNLGLGDAMNLGWKLAATVHGWALDGLLDTYTAERHPVGAWVLNWSRAQIALMRVDPLTEALRGIVGDLIASRDGATYFAKKLSGMLHHYAIPGDHRLVGRLAPDLELADGTRVADHGHRGQAVLVGADALAESAMGWSNRLRYVRRTEGVAMLVRPDGYVAWAAEDAGDSTGLHAALNTWLGSSLSRR